MIVPAVSAVDRAAVYRLRYDVLVGEQGIDADASIDHTVRTVIDPADATAVVLASWSDGKLTGTVRTNLLRDGSASPFCKLLGLDRLTATERQNISVTSRLFVDARWRRSPLAVRLAQTISLYCRKEGMVWDYIIVRPEMSSFFARLGYESGGAITRFPGVGCIVPMRLNLDLKHLSRIRSTLIAGVNG